MIVRKIAFALGIAGILAAGLTPASAAEVDGAIVSAPNEDNREVQHGYATPVTFVSPGGKLQYTNFDVVGHNVVSEAKGPDSNPWCNTGKPFGWPAGQCPLFQSAWNVGSGATVAVSGVSQLTPGEQYSFYCRPHPWMIGTLVVVSPVA